MMNDREKSDPAIVAAKPANNASASKTDAAELVERHGGAMLRCVRDVVLSGWCKSSPKEVTTFVADGNCVAAMRGGEQPEAKRQPEG